MVSMKDISETCGVSIATVSKALNGRTDISTSTKERGLRWLRRWAMYQTHPLVH